MKKFLILFSFVMLGLGLVACGGTAENVETAVSESNTSAVEVAANTQTSGGGEGLNEDYADAVSVQTQLILGSLSLADTDLAIDEAQANELLPLWQAMQALGESSTTATAETNAVLKQIQGEMSAEQIVAIVDMQLTSEDTQTILQESGGFRGRGGAADGEAGQAPEGRQGFGGGGGLPGGGPGGGQGPGGLGGGEIDPSARETRIAERFGEGVDPLAQILMDALIRNLQVTAGLVDEAALPAGNGRNGLGNIMPLIAEKTGLEVEDIRAQLQDGATFADIISNNGGDVEAITEAMLEPLSEAEDFDEAAARAQIEEMLNGGFGQPQN